MPFIYYIEILLNDGNLHSALEIVDSMVLTSLRSGTYDARIRALFRKVYIVLLEPGEHLFNIEYKDKELHQSRSFAYGSHSVTMEGSISQAQIYELSRTGRDNDFRRVLHIVGSAAAGGLLLFAVGNISK